MDVFFKKYFWVVHLLSVGLCAGFVGRAASHLVVGAVLSGDPPRPSGPARPPAASTQAHSKDTEEIVKRNLFCSGCAPPPPPKAETGTGPVSTEPQKSSLQLELVSTMLVPSDPAWSMAVIRDLSTKEKDSSLFGRGMPVFSTGATLERVVSKRVYLKTGARLEYIEMDGAAPPPPVAAAAPAPSPGGITVDPNTGDVDKGVSCTGNNCVVEKQLVEKLLSNTAALATAARFVPSIKDGKANGFKLYAIRPNSIFAKIGLQNGDTIKSINGMDMSSPDKALEAYTKLRSASHLGVAVERHNETITLDYSIR
jgi:general secretion pathway protein C